MQGFELIESNSDGLTVVARAGTNSALLGMSLDDDLVDVRDRNLAGFAIWRTPEGRPEEPLLNFFSFAGPGTPTPSYAAPFQRFRWTDVPPTGLDRPITYRVQALYFTGSGVETRAGPQARVALQSATQSERMRVGFTRGILADSDWLHREAHQSIRPPGRRRPDFDTAPYRQVYEWLGGDARRLLFDFLAECESDRSARIDVFAYGLDEPDIVAAICRLGKQKRLRAILDDSLLHTLKAGRQGSPPEIITARMIVAAAGAKNVRRGHFGQFQNYRAIIKRDRDGTPKSVLFGSINFSLHGLYLQSNNVFVVRDLKAASLFGDAFYIAFSDGAKWKTFARSPIANGWISIGKGEKLAFGPHLKAEASLDLVASAIRQAKHSVLFSVSGRTGRSPVFHALRAAAARPEIFCYGAVQTDQGLAVQSPTGIMSALMGSPQLTADLPTRTERWGPKGMRLDQKFVVVDFNSDNPLVFTGSSNFDTIGAERDGHSLVLTQSRGIASAFAVEAIRQIDRYNFQIRMASRGRSLSAAAVESPALWHPGRPDPPWWQPYYEHGDVALQDRRLFVTVKPGSPPERARKQADWRTLDAPPQRFRVDVEKEPLPRWIQVSAVRGDAPLTVARSLAPAQWNLLAVHIGPSEEFRSDAAFPERLVDFSRGDVSVMAQLELAGASVMALESSDIASAMHRSFVWPVDIREGSNLAREMLLRGPVARLAAPTVGEKGSPTVVALVSAEIVLPPAGDSTLALFVVYPHEAKVQGRIAIVHNARILQTARLLIDVDAAADRGTGLTYAAEAAIHTCDDDLDQRREYDVAIQVSDIGGKLHLTIQRDGTATPVQLEDLDGPIRRITSALDQAAVGWDYAQPMLKQAVFAKCLYTLASCGSELDHQLRKTCGDSIDEWQRIHLVPSTIEFFPLEYVYTGPPPKTGAEVCPNVLGALENGTCDRAVPGSPDPGPCPNQHDKGFLCPMHFWGFGRLIERNGTTSPEMPASGTQGTSMCGCVPTKSPYGKVEGLLFAASNRVFRYKTKLEEQAWERAALLKELAECFGNVADVSNWDDWRERVEKTTPNLLLLVAHSDKYLSTPVLEIGDKQLLGRHEIDRDLSGAAGRPQLLVLLGCSTAGVTENFQPYPERFRDAGVSIVLAPVAPIRGADAVPIAKALAHLLQSRLAQPEPTAFGELLPLLRRQLLRAGQPGVMGVVGFGDGDWLLGGQ